MKTEHLGITIAIVFFWIVASMMLILGGSVSAVESTTVKLLPSVDKVRIGLPFTVEVVIEPAGGIGIAGAQIDIRYNPLAVRVDGVVQGNFLSRTGYQVYFDMVGETGGIHNDTGQVNNIIGVLIGQDSVATESGIFCTLNCTALNAGSSSDFAMENVIVGDKTGNAVSLVLMTGQITVVPLADLNLDGVVNVSDIILIASRFGTPDADLNDDKATNVLDIIIASKEIV